MAIAPIDLQAIFSQVDKVGKSQMALKESQTIQQAVQNIQLQKKTEENINQVNEAQNTGEGAEKVNDEGHRQNQGGNNEKKQKEKSEELQQVSVLRDPSLGKNIDISL